MVINVGIDNKLLNKENNISNSNTVIIETINPSN